MIADSQSKWLLRFMAPVAALTPALTCVSPRIMGTFFIAFGLIGMIADSIQHKRWPFIDTTLGKVLLAALIWGALSLTWSIAPDDSMSKVGQLTGVFLSLAFLAAKVNTFTVKDLDFLGRMLLIGACAGTAVYYFEWFSNFWLYDLTHGPNTDIEDIKQNKVIVMLGIWVSLCFPYVFAARQKPLYALYGALVAAIVFATQASPSNSAIIVMAGLPIVIAAAIFIPWRKFMIGACVTIMLVMSFGMLPGSRYIAVYHPETYKNLSIRSSIKARLEMWDQASRRILERPILGWGLNSSPSLPNRGEVQVSIDDADPLSDDRVPIAHLHPHNAPLQIWFELGLIGMLFYSGVLVVIGKGLRHVTSRAGYAFGFVVFVQTFLYTLSIWGIWQT